jgi:hypothetical protein
MLEFDEYLYHLKYQQESHLLLTFVCHSAALYRAFPAIFCFLYMIVYQIIFLQPKMCFYGLWI